MSYCQLVVFKDGLPCESVEFRNAWGGSARIWDTLFKRHVPKKSQYDSWVSDPHDRRLWDLAKREDLQLFERAVHAFTFDRFYVRREHFGRLSLDLRLFVDTYPAGACVDHLPAWANWLDENNEIEAVGLYGTSVSENIWFRTKECPHCGNQTDETEPVPMSEGTEVYDWLESLSTPSKPPESA